MERITLSPDPLNFLASLVGDVLDGLTVMELWAGEAKVTDRLLSEGASRALCVDPEPPEDRVERDEIVWIPTDPMNVLGEDRGDDVGLVHVAVPEDVETTVKDVLETLPRTKYLERNCLVVLAERPYDRVQLSNFDQFEEIDTRRFDDLQLTVTQMIDPMAAGF